VTEREQAEGQEEQRQRRAWVHKLDRHAATSIRGADGRGGRAGGREPCRGSLWAEDRVGCTNSLPGLEWCDFQRDRIYAAHGLRDDRHWLVLNPDGTVLTASKQHRMLGVTAGRRETATSA